MCSRHCGPFVFYESGCFDVVYRNLDAKRTRSSVGFLMGMDHGVTLWPKE